MKRLNSLLVVLFVACAVLLMACGDTNTAGTVTDTGNTIAGVVSRADGSAASNATVRMALRVKAEDGVLAVPENVETVTDSLGAFVFDSALADTFQLAVIDTSAAEIFYLPKTTVEDHDLDSIRLEKGAVFTSVLYYENSDSSVQVGSHFIVTLAGTPFYKSIFAGDTFSILIPAGGEGNIEVYPGDPQIVAKLQESGVEDSSIYRAWELEDSSTVNSDTVGTDGPLMWSLNAGIDSLIKIGMEAAKKVARIGGTVYCKSGKACDSVEVMLITDLYGFNFTEGDSLEFTVNTVTDSLGHWWLSVPDSVPQDSFRVEFRLMSDGFPVQSGVSRYVQADEVDDLNDTLDLGEVTLKKTSALNSGVTLVIDATDSTQSTDCMLNSVVVGIKGTSHFKRDVTCSDLPLSDLPMGEQDVVLYSGDPKVMSKLLESDTPMEYYVVQITVSLPEGNTQQVQWMTYTPPSQKLFSEKD